MSQEKFGTAAECAKWLDVPTHVVKSCYAPQHHRVTNGGRDLEARYHVLELDRELLRGVMLLYARAMSDGDAAAGFKDWNALSVKEEQTAIQDALGRAVSHPTRLRVRAMVRRALITAMENP